MSKRRLFTHGERGRVLFAPLCLIALVVAVVACTSGERPLTPGKVDLEFDGVSDSDVTVTLGNGRDGPIYIRGQRIAAFLPIRMFSTDTRISCDTPQGGHSALFGFTEVKPTYIEVSPGKRVKLVIPTTFPQQYKGNRCTVEVSLKDGSVAGPAEFRP